jgi:NAD(P)H-flavin reductase
MSAMPAMPVSPFAPAGVKTSAADPMRPELHRIRRVHAETDDTFTLDLAPESGAAAMTWRPGQFNMVYVPGVGEIPLSISGASAAGSRLLHTTRAVGTVTRAMQGLRVGDLLGVRGPFGVGWPVGACPGQDVVLVAGGIGLAPLRPALYHLLADRDRVGRIVVLYGCRRPSDLLFRHEIEQWRSRLDMHVYVSVDRAEGQWHGYVGVVTALIPKAPVEPRRTVAMVCGPEVMMRFTAMKLEECGVPPSSIYLSMERNMKCGIGLCGHCQCGPCFVCKDGPVFSYDRLRHLLGQREV